MTVATLPKILFYEFRTDAGEYGGDSCSHCGADGRYQMHFVAKEEDGTIVHRAAMAGCIKLFPVSPLAKRQEKLMLKADEYAKKGWSLNRADTDSLAAIDEVLHGELSEDEAIERINKNDAGMKAWRQARGGRY